MSSQSNRPNVTVTTLMEMKRKGEKFASLTAYDACFAALYPTLALK